MNDYDFIGPSKYFVFDPTPRTREEVDVAARRICDNSRRENEAYWFHFNVPNEPKAARIFKQSTGRTRTIVSKDGALVKLEEWSVRTEHLSGSASLHMEERVAAIVREPNV